MINIICAIVKNENLYLLDWVDYHLGIGFDKIYIFDNNDKQGQRIEDVLGERIGSGSVELIDVRGRKRFQTKAYTWFSGRKDIHYDWCAFIDIDEYLTFSPQSGYTRIADFMATVARFDIVHVSWMCYGDNDLLHYQDKPVCERFTRPADRSMPINRHVKSIVRSGLEIEWHKNPHTPCGARLRVCNEHGKAVENSPFQPNSTEIIYLRHFYTKTIEEYITLKLSRGGGNGGIPDMDAFYAFNNRSEQKSEIEKRLLSEVRIVKPSFFKRLKRWLSGR